MGELTVWHSIVQSQIQYLDSTNFKTGVLQRLLKERNMKHIGVIAQEVEQIVPEVVRMSPSGTLSVEYFSLIGLLIEAIKEQQREIENMYDNLSGMMKNSINKTSSTSLEENYLYQNVPNPFNKVTIIKFKLSEQVRKASILIFNMEGTLLKTYEILNFKEEINVFGNEFKPGMYLYSLIADGTEVDTKRMILTE